ncbi:ADIPOR-like receptor IZH3 [Spathaspora sp. JA1]|nr:ADIPOR-like receptor IZH3 [Spathaspora sp. JA1]
MSHLQVPRSDLRNRFTPTHSRSRSPSISTEEILVEKLDTFISSLESRLNNFEQYFKLSCQEELYDTLDKKNEVSCNSHDIEMLEVPRSRSRSSSFHQIKNFSINQLSQIHQRLVLIKKSVLTTSFTNLEYLYKTLDEQYKSLFSEEVVIPAVLDNDNKSEVLSKKIIQTIQYFDEKLLLIDDFLKNYNPPMLIDETLDETHDVIFNKLRFFNFHRALHISEKNNQLLHYYQLPLSWRENKYIIQGYRFSLSHMTMWKSMFQFNHNESMNIWTHLIGLLFILYLSFWHFPNSPQFANNTWNGNLIMYIFLIAACKCLISSSIWHTYSCFAHFPTRQTLACVDYTGITVLITCSVISVEYCALYNFPKLLTTYIIFSTVCGTTGFIFNWSPYFDKPECRSLRIWFFMGLAILGASAILWKMFYHGILPSILFILPLVYKSFAMYWIGVIFYGGLIPERWRYDVIIDEYNTLSHTYTTQDVLLDNVENAGVEEIEQMEHELEEVVEEQSHIDEKFKQVIDKHFKPMPNYTVYKNDFKSLWWVDYFLASHNIWHIFVVLGIVGHYSCVMEMFSEINHA